MMTKPAPASETGKDWVFINPVAKTTHYSPISLLFLFLS